MVYWFSLLSGLSFHTVKSKKEIDKKGFRKVHVDKKRFIERDIFTSRKAGQGMGIIDTNNKRQGVMTSQPL